MRRTCFLAAFLLLVLTGAARAAEQTVNFDDLAAGTLVTTQYLNAGGTNQGVELGKGTSGQAEGATPQVLALAAGQAQSGTNVADICDSCNKEFSTTQVWGHFPFLKSLVRVYVGSVSGNATVHLQGYDASGHKIATAYASAAITAGAGAHTPLEVHGNANIAFFEVSPATTSGHQRIVVDDLSFDVPDPQQPPPPPGFAIHWPGPAFPTPDGALGINQGHTASTQVLITRTNGSQGTINFSVSGLPQGVTAAFNPSPSTSGDSVGITFSAADDAPPTTAHDVTISATAVDPSAAGAGTQTTKVPLHIFGAYDLAVQGIEVVQAVQRWPTPTTLATDNTFPGLPPNTPGQPVTYNGVGLAANGTTVARVWAGLARPDNASLDDVGLALHAYRNGKELAGSPLVGGFRTLGTFDHPFVTPAFMADPLDAWEFTLPAAWTHGTIKLKATLAPPAQFLNTTEIQCETAECVQNDSETLQGIKFTTTKPVTLTLLHLIDKGESPTSPLPQDLLSSAEAVAPTFDGGLQYDHFSYTATLNIHDIAMKLDKCLADAGTDKDDRQDCDDDANDDVHDVVDDWADDNSHGYITIGVNHGTARGVTSGKITEGDSPTAVVDDRRPFTSVAHELFHALGRLHASPCNHGGDNGQQAEDWLPDNEGWVQGVGLDRRPNSFQTGVFGTVAAPVTAPFGITKTVGTDKQLFDFMSYCAAVRPDFDSWIGVRGWNETLKDLHDFSFGEDVRAAEPAASGPMLRVRAYANGGGVQLTRVTPLAARAGEHTAIDRTSPFKLQLLGAHGKVMGAVGMTMEVGHNENTGPVVFLKGQVPVAGAAVAAGLPAARAGAALTGVRILQNGHPVAKRMRSKHVPKVRILAPRKGAKVGAGRFVTVRWRATDADHDRLQSKVDFSTNGGRTWRTVGEVAGAEQLKLPSALFAGSRRARIRVRVNDGFNEGHAVSRIFRTVKHRAKVAISTRRVGAVGGRTRSYELSGAAYDDSGHPVAGGALSWFSGHHLLGRGDHLSVRVLPKRLGVRIGGRPALVRSTAR